MTRIAARHDASNRFLRRYVGIRHKIAHALLPSLKPPTPRVQFAATSAGRRFARSQKLVELLGLHGINYPKVGTASRARFRHSTTSKKENTRNGFLYSCNSAVKPATNVVCANQIL